MKLTCQRDSLLSACQLTSQAVMPRSPKPALACVKAMAQDDALTLMGTDLEVGIRYELRGVNVRRAGSALFSVTRLVNALRESSDKEVTIDASADGTLLTTKSGKYNFPAGDPAEFPDVPTFDTGGHYHEIPAALLRTMLRRTSFAADKREVAARWAVTGVLWELDGEKLKLVATDTKRLAMTTGSVSVHGTPPDGKAASHLIPQKAITLLDRSLTDDGAGIRVAVNANEALFENGPVIIHTRLVEGRFPPYRDIIPKKVGTRVLLDTPAFFTSVRQAAVTTDEQTKRVDFAFAPGGATLKAEGPESGSSEVTLELPGYDGPDIDIAFDPQYLTDMLRAIEGEPNVLLEMTDGLKPAVFRCGDDYLYLVMPLAG